MRMLLLGYYGLDCFVYSMYSSIEENFLDKLV